MHIIGIVIKFDIQEGIIQRDSKVQNSKLDMIILKLYDNKVISIITIYILQIMYSYLLLHYNRKTRLKQTETCIIVFICNANFSSNDLYNGKIFFIFGDCRTSNVM